jgi:hypothetical protein
VEKEPIITELYGVRYVDGKAPWELEPHKANWLIAEYEIGGTIFKIYGGRTRTLEEAAKVLEDRRTLINTYAYISGDTRSALPLRACKTAMLQEIQVKWFEFNQFEVPPRVQQRLEECMAKAQAKAAEAEGTETEGKSKEPRITNRSIIEAGLLAGKSDEDIVAEVKEHFPNGKADAKHVAYYRHFLVKDGKLEAQPRKTRAKKAEEPAPETTKAAAAPAARKAAAAPAKAAPARAAAAKR